MNIGGLHQPSMTQLTQNVGSSYEVRPKSSGQGSVSGGRQITRNRASYSCHACRRRKVKCDKVHPVCANCTKTHDDCVYDSNGVTKSSPTSIGSTPKNFIQQYISSGDYQQSLKRRRTSTRQTGENGTAASGASEDDDSSVDRETSRALSAEQSVVTPKDIESRLDRLTAMVEQLTQNVNPRQTDVLYGIVGNGLKQQHSDHTHLLASKESSRYHSNCQADVEHRRQGHGGDHAHLNEIGPDRGHRDHEDNFPLPVGQHSDLVDPVSNLTLGHLSLQEGGRSRYVGITYWACVSDEIAELNQLLRDQNRYYGATSVNNNLSHQAAKELTLPAPGGNDSTDMPKPQHRAKGTPDVNSDPTRLNEPLLNHGLLDKSLLFKSDDDAANSIRFNTMYSEMLTQLPTKRQCHALYRCYILGVHPVMPLIHPPTMLGYYEEFWKWYEEKNPSKTPYAHPSFIPLLFAMLYGGSVSCSAKKLKAEFGEISRSSLSGRLHDHVTRCLSLISFPRTPTLPSLIAFLIVQTILAKEEEPLTSSSFIGLGLRVAQIMGLHRDGAQFGLDPCEAEVRRRVWWHIVHMDGVMSISSGLPPLVNDEGYWDVRSVSELKDRLLDTAEGSQYRQAVLSGKRVPDLPDDPLKGGGNSYVSVVHVMAQGKYFMAQTARKILKIQLGVRPLVRGDLEILKEYLRDVETKLNESIRRIPTRGNPEMGLTDDEEPPKHPDFDYDPNRAHPPTAEELQLFVGMTPEDGLNHLAVHYHQRTMIAYHRWARIMLSLLINKAYCIVYQPFLKNVKSKLWAHALPFDTAMDSCESSFSWLPIRLFNLFSGAGQGKTNECRVVSALMEAYRSHQPMHPTMIMLIDLFERPHSAEAPRSRAFIDQIFALSGPDGGIVHGEDGVSVQRPLREGGREAWDMLRRLRQKAWQKAGLDPDVLWTEKAQMSVGIPQEPSSGEHMMRGLRDNVIYKSDTDLANATDADTPKPRTLDAFHGLVKAAQADAEASQSANGSGIDTSLDQTRPGTERNKLNGSAQLQTHTNARASHPTDTEANQPRQAQPKLRSPPQSVSANPRQSSHPLKNGADLPQNVVAPKQKETKTASGLQSSPHMNNADPRKSSYAQIPSSLDDVDSSQEFDWAQWDAVFGQYVPVDDLMDLDAGETWRFGQE